ncbi:hypothetical protein JCM8202_003725 [Rhodotorula sphaerocarpa]
MKPVPSGAPTGNLSHSMRENYNSHGVEDYYRIVQESYRNPHYPGLKRVLAALMDRFVAQEKPESIKILDLAAGSGEATEALLAWKASRWPQGPTTAPAQPVSDRDTPSDPAASASPAPAAPPSAVPPPQQQQQPPSARPPFIPPNRPFPSRAVARPPLRTRPGSAAAPISAPDLQITAADPFTSPAYRARTGLPCLELSFADVAAGRLPAPGTTVIAPPAADPQPDDPDPDDSEPEPYDLVIISFALHLVESSSELWALLTELSKRAKWLVVTAPHKKPDVKDSWGWRRWDPSPAWKPAEGRGQVGGTGGDGFEIVLDRVRLRLWRSEAFLPWDAGED